MKLNELSVGESVRIIDVGSSGALRQHLLDMGLIPGVELTLIKFAPMGDPMEIRVNCYELTLRLEDAENITVEKIENISENFETACNKKAQDMDEPRRRIEHLGLGEEGRFHRKGEGNPLPEDRVLRFALVGNQNSGKTTLFNSLTGSNQRIGNFPGVTVERKEGVIKGYKNTALVDLPGIYSMSPYSNEEILSRDFVLNEKPDALINIVDATNIERNMYLTMQLLELGVPMILALNMMDELRGNGGYIDVNLMEEMLGVPTIPISAAKDEGVQELISHAVHIARYQEKPLKQDYCSLEDNDGAVHRCLHAVAHLIEDSAIHAEIPVRFAATKVIEGDKLILEKLGLDEEKKATLEHIIVDMENERGLDRGAAIADMRFAFINKVTEECVSKSRHSKEYDRSHKMDRILTGKYTAIPTFALIMSAIFFLTFDVIGTRLQNLLEGGIESFTLMTENALVNWDVNNVLRGLIIDGIFEGVGSVLSFLPIIITLFFFLSILEDSGYTARVAFFMDKLLRKIGLSGRSIVPLLIGFGCTVPAIMSTRILPSERDRKMTILLTPFMSCTAKLPIYAFFVSVFFPNHGGIVMVAMYLIGIVVGILVALIFKRTIFQGEPVPFVMELPNYRIPRLKNVAQLLWEKARDFLQRAFSIILVATVIVWFLQSFDTQFNLAANNEDSILAVMGGAIAPIFTLAGINDWRISVSLISGFIAKESVVSVMNVLYAGTDIQAIMNSLQAFSLLVFSVLYTPCVAAIASVRRELGSKIAVGVVLWQCTIAWLASVLVYQIGSLIL
ncbi:MAG: ferrous iron transport protein B [Clostridiales bacterium]|nr:ferrous iron transport protein B [Clostridiales bacterium]